MKLMANQRVLCLIIASLMTTSFYSDHVFAADKKDKASRRAAQMLQKAKQQMEQEKANMQSQFDVEKKELEDKLKSNDEQLQQKSASLNSTQRKLINLESEHTKISQEKTLLEAKLLETQKNLENSQQSLADLTTQYQQAQTDLKINDNQRKTLSTNLAGTNLALRTCEQKNTKLYQFGAELIKIYDEPGLYTAVMRDEPFFQLKRIELENILQNQKDKMDEEKVSTN